MNICVKASFDVATYLDHVKATHKRMMWPAKAIKDAALPRRYHRVEAEEQHDDKPLLQVEQEVKLKRSIKKLDAV